MVYGKKEKTRMLKRVRDKRQDSHKRARRILIGAGFTIVKDKGAVTNLSWDFIAEKDGITYLIDAKTTLSEKGSYTIRKGELQRLLNLKDQGLPSYLLVLNGKGLLFTLNSKAMSRSMSSSLHGGIIKGKLVAALGGG